jgi:hypothetical protein
MAAALPYDKLDGPLAFLYEITGTAFAHEYATL